MNENPFGILDVRVRFTNGMELSQNEGDLNELFGMVRKMLGYGYAHRGFCMRKYKDIVRLLSACK